MSKHDLRAELDQLARMIDNAPRDQSRLVAHATKQREQHEHRLVEATGRRQQARDLVASLERGPARFLRRGGLGRVREQAEQAEEAYQVARQQADRAADRERQARQALQQHEAHQEANPDLLARQRELLRVQGWRNRAEARAVELEQPGWSRDLGDRPATVKGGRAWDRAVEQTVEYRQRWKVTDPERALGPEPHGKDVPLEQRHAWRHAERSIGRTRDLPADRNQRSDRTDVTGRHRSDHGRPDHHDRDQERD
jgi:hypothetical protein